MRGVASPGVSAAIHCGVRSSFRQNLEVILLQGEHKALANRASSDLSFVAVQGYHGLSKPELLALRNASCMSAKCVAL